MARKLFVVAILLLAVALGVFGYQTLQYLKAGNWPSVSIHLVWGSLFGATSITSWLPFHAIWPWVAQLPLTLAIIAASYLTFLASDLLRAR